MENSGEPIKVRVPGRPGRKNAFFVFFVFLPILACGMSDYGFLGVLSPFQPLVFSNKDSLDIKQWYFGFIGLHISYGVYKKNRQY